MPEPGKLAEGLSALRAAKRVDRERLVFGIYQQQRKRAALLIKHFSGAKLVIANSTEGRAIALIVDGKITGTILAINETTIVLQEDFENTEGTFCHFPAAPKVDSVVRQGAGDRLPVFSGIAAEPNLHTVSRIAGLPFHRKQAMPAAGVLQIRGLEGAASAFAFFGSGSFGLG